MGSRLWGRTESDTTEATSQQQQQCATVINCSDENYVEHRKNTIQLTL